MVRDTERERDGWWERKREGEMVRGCQKGAGKRVGRDAPDSIGGMFWPESFVEVVCFMRFPGAVET